MVLLLLRKISIVVAVAATVVALSGIRRGFVEVKTSVFVVKVENIRCRPWSLLRSGRTFLKDRVLSFMKIHKMISMISSHIDPYRHQCRDHITLWNGPPTKPKSSTFHDFKKCASAIPVPLQ